jgi:hypothetical protein
LHYCTDDVGATPAPWSLKTGRNVVTRWVEFEPVAP